jgi:CDGSH-type Zn-finger protein
VLPDAASADEVAETITHCPTGALHFTRKDGGPPEMPDGVNTVSPSIDGPLFLGGDIVIQTPDGEVALRDTRMALCRCGASKNKPFCDKSHEQIGFRHNGLLGDNKVRTDEGLPQAGLLKIIPSENGPLVLRGPFEVRGCDRTVHAGNRTKLCRCGKSSNKPFCDDTHARIGFQSK